MKSSTLELDQNADLISQEWYYPYGGTACFAARSATEAKYKTVRYSGKERDATGLYYYGFRYYTPWLQRWINPDPAGYVDGMNLFAMTGNNPAVYFDERGNVRSNFNQKQYFEDFKRLLDEHQSPLFFKNKARAKHYIKKLHRPIDPSKDEQLAFFMRQVGKLSLVTRSVPKAYPKHGEAFMNFNLFLAEAGTLGDFDYIYKRSANSQSTSNSSYGHDFQRDQSEQRQAGASSRPTPGTSNSSHFESEWQGFDSSTGARRTQQSERAPSNPPNNSIYPTPLPQGTSNTIIKGYELAINIINNERNERAIFPEGINSFEFRNTSRLIHPDKLNLEDSPHVQMAATKAFQIILSWKDHAERSN